MKLFILFYVFFVFKAFSDSSPLSPQPEVMNDGVKNMPSKINSFKDIFELSE